jgi:hypothetical protein
MAKYYNLLALISIFILGLVSYLIFPQIIMIRLMALIIMAMAFIIWGISQYKAKKIPKNILLEYLLLGMLALALLFFLIYHD